MSDDALGDPLAWLRATAPQAATAQPARWQGLLALAGRAASAQGRLRERLVERLRERLAQLPPAPAGLDPAPVAGPLRALGELLGQQVDALPPLRSQQLHQRSWTELRVARRLAELRPAQPPSQALGPLNTLALLPRALALLGDASPEYLQRFFGYLDALEALPPVPEPAPPRGRALKPGGAAR